MTDAERIADLEARLVALLERVYVLESEVLRLRRAKK